MRILDEKQDKKLDTVFLLLTEEELSEMRDSINDLLHKKDGHHHINNPNFDKEITIAIYNKENFSSFGDRFKKLIEKDE